jgi:hypothetical protein
LLVLSWLEGPSPAHRRALVSASALAGLAFAVKPNVGIAVTAAIGVLVLLNWGPEGRMDVARGLGPALAIAGAVVGAVAATGGLSAFGADVFAGKTHYLDAFTGGYLPGLQHLDQVLPWIGSPAETYANRIWLTGSLVPVLAVSAVGAAVVMARPHRRAAVVLGLFALVGVAASVPRSGPQHLAETAPIFLTVLAAALGILAPTVTGRPASRFLAGAVAVWLGIAAGAVVWRAVESFPHPGESLHGLPHLTGALSSARTRRTARAVAADLRAAHVRTVFIVRPDAAFYYLVDGLHNPTPYDFPEVSDLGADDQDGVIRLLQRGAVRWVCVPPAPVRGVSSSPTRPLRLEAYVRRHFVRAGSAHICTLYRFPARHPMSRP